ncbi:MAG: cation diffusion facilitator family transporter [Chloroflexi bacterium]|nr:cation diffusion facilitator family transporter [Chloroflexota bacterium]
MSKEARLPTEEHHHEHEHSPSEASGAGGRLLLSIGITALVCAVEVGGGLWTGSLALLSDAAHVFLDVFALAMSYGALRLAALPPNARHSYGYRRAEVLAALINAVTLIVVAVGIGKEAWDRWQAPVSIHSGEMLAIAAFGLTANLLTALTLSGHTHGNLNVKSAFIHVLGDALASVGVIVAALVMLATGWYAADPVVSVLIGLLIAYSGWGVLRQAVHILMEGAPEGLATDEVARSMAATEGVLGVHDLHLWSTGSDHPMLSAHIRVAEAELPHSPALVARLRGLLEEKYGIDHATLQVECVDCGQGSIDCLGAKP